ncbi:MAG: c-type cytochrome, partial [Archangium sp.]|nr:c-type cytochrome [Archangium sp.]
MSPRLVIALALVAFPALAADSARGFVVFNERCASCHTAQHDARERKQSQAPDLALRLKQKDGAALNAWILEPAKRQKETPCETRALIDDREALADLWAWLQGKVDAPPSPRAERRKDELDRT